VLIPLWIPWTLLLAACLSSLLARDAERRWLRDPARLAIALLALVVAVVLTADRYQVGEDELYEAAQRAADLSDGLAATASADRLGALIEERLGRDPVLTSVTVERDDDASTTAYDVSVGDGEPLVCLTVRAQQSEVPITSVGATRGACAADPGD